MTVYIWETLPVSVVADVEHATGPVVKAETVTGGLMPGLTAVIHGDNGQRRFLKAAPADSPAAHLYRQEMTANRTMPPGVPAPAMRHTADSGGWLVMVFDYLADARDADLSPGSPDLPGVLDTMKAIADAEACDCTRPVAENVSALQVKAAKMLGRLPDGNVRDMYAAAVDGFEARDLGGARLVHYDLHAGNLKMTGGQVLAVDWAFACKGARWTDAALLVPRLVAAGHSPVAAERFVSDLPGWETAPARAVTGLAALWTMFREYKALYGPPDAREFRARAADAGRSWITYRMSTRGALSALR
jgi:aminoglycoside phosphotransferase (APT) family kinase protein